MGGYDREVIMDVMNVVMWEGREGGGRIPANITRVAANVLASVDTFSMLSRRTRMGGDGEVFLELDLWTKERKEKKEN